MHKAQCRCALWAFARHNGHGRSPLSCVYLPGGLFSRGPASSPPAGPRRGVNGAGVSGTVHRVPYLRASDGGYRDAQTGVQEPEWNPPKQSEDLGSPSRGCVPVPRARHPHALCRSWFEDPFRGSAESDRLRVNRSVAQPTWLSSPARRQTAYYYIHSSMYKYTMLPLGPPSSPPPTAGLMFVRTRTWRNWRPWALC